MILGKTVTTEFAWMQPRATLQSVGRDPHARRLQQRFGRGGGCRRRQRRARHAGVRLDPAAGQFLRLLRLQADGGAINRGGSHDALSQSTHGPIAASLPEAWHVAIEISRRAGGDPGFPGLYGPLSLHRAVEAEPAGGSRNRRLGDGDAGSESRLSGKRGKTEIGGRHAGVAP